MKKSICLIFVITLILTLVGGHFSIQKDMLIKTTSPLNSQTSEKKKYTVDDAIAVFRKNKDFDNYVIVDCDLVDDNKMPQLKAVISFYDKKKNNSCKLSFIYGDSSQEICFATNEKKGVKTFEVADNSNLTYIGDGTVITSVRKIDTNEIINYKIIFSYEESTSTSNFKIISEKPTT